MWYLAVVIVLVTGCAATEGTIPALQNPLPLVTSTNLPASEPTQVPSPLPKRNPVKDIYVVAQVSPRWGLKPILAEWNKAKFVDFHLVKACPEDWSIPCLSIIETNKLSVTIAGETDFGSDPNTLSIRLNRRVLDKAEAQTTLCHELGHILGVGHIVGRLDTCMTEGGTTYVGPPKPTKLDLMLVDRLGSWDQQKMYLSSIKVIDLRKRDK